MKVIILNTLFLLSLLQCQSFTARTGHAEACVEQLKSSVVRLYGGGDRVEATLRTTSYHHYTKTRRIYLRISWQADSKRQWFWADGIMSIDLKHQRYQWRAEHLSNNLTAHLDDLKIGWHHEEVELRLGGTSNRGKTICDEY